MDLRQASGKKRQMSSLVLALLLCSANEAGASKSSMTHSNNQHKLYDYMQTGSSGVTFERPSGPLEDSELLQIGSNIDQTQSSEIDSQADQQEGQQADVQSSSEEQAYQQSKQQHRNEVAAYKQWFKYSPFYLRRHPEARHEGDIEDIQQLSQQRSGNGDELAGVENVFEKNFKKFNNILSHSDASQQLAQVKNQMNADQSQQQEAPQQQESKEEQLRQRQQQIQRLKRQIQKQKNKQSLSQVNRKHGGQQRRQGQSAATAQRQQHGPALQGRKNNQVGRGSRSQQNRKGHQKRHSQRVVHQIQPKPASSFDHLDTNQQNDDALFQSRQEQKLDENVERLTIVPATMRSFNSVPMEKNEETNDYSKPAEVAKPNRRMMDKIAQLENQVLAMGSRIQQLEIEKKEDEGQLQLLQTKVHHFELEEETQGTKPAANGYQGLAGSSVLIHDGNDQEAGDMMNLQLDQENVILDTITSLKDSIASLFTSTKKTQQGQDQNQASSQPVKKETSLDHLNRVIKETDEKAEKRAKEEFDKLHRRPPASSLDQVKDTVNVQLASNNEMHLLSELQQFSSMISNISASKNATLSKNETKVEAVQQHEKKKSWTEIKAEAKAELEAKKKMEAQAAAEKVEAEPKKNQSRPGDAMNVQATQEESAEQDFEEQIQDDISLVGLPQGIPQRHFVPIRVFRGSRMQQGARRVSADDAEDAMPEPQPTGEGKMPRNVGMLNRNGDPRREFDQPVPVWGNPEQYKIKNQPLAQEGKGPFDRSSNPFEQFRNPAEDEDEDEDEEVPRKVKKADEDEEDEPRPVKKAKKVKSADDADEEESEVPRLKTPVDEEVEEIENTVKDKVKEKQRLRREKEMNKLKSKIENQEERSEFENAVRNHRKMRKKAKKAKKDKKKKEKRQYRDNKEKKSTEDVTEPEEDYDTDQVAPSSMDKLRKIHDKIKKSQPGATPEDGEPEKPKPKQLKSKKPTPYADGAEPAAPAETTPTTEEPQPLIPPLPESMKKNTTDDEDVKRAKEIIQEDKKSSVDSDVIDQAVKPFANINTSGLKDHIQKAVEETVKKEVGDSMAKQATACPYNTPTSQPMTPEEKKKEEKNKKIQNEIAKQVRDHGLDKKAVREVEAKERQDKLHKVKKKLEKEIEHHSEAEKKAADIASKLKEHHSVVSKALQDTKRYRQENKESGCSDTSNRDEYESQDEHESEHASRHHKRSHGRHHHSSHDVEPTVQNKHFWRDQNDDDNPTYPELRRPVRRGNADIDQTENPDLPNLSRKEAEDFDRLVVEAKKEKEEKEKKEKEEKEKKEKEEKEGKKDDKKDDKKDAKKAFSQMKHHKHHGHHGHHGHQGHPQQPFRGQGYVQLEQEMLVKQNSTAVAAKNTTVNATAAANATTVVRPAAAPMTVNESKPVLAAKNVTESKPAVKVAQAVLKNANTTGVIDLVQKNATKATSLVQVKKNATKPEVALKNTTATAKQDKKTNKTKKHASVPIQEIEDDSEMETEQDIVESSEEQEKDFKDAEMQEKSAVETEEDIGSEVTSHTATSLREQQEKWTSAEEMAEQKKLKEELEKEQKKQEELKKKEESDKEEEKKEKEREAKEEQMLKEKQEKESKDLKVRLADLEKKEKETKMKVQKDLEKVKLDAAKNQTEIEKSVASYSQMIAEEDKKMQDQIQLQEKMTEVEEKQIEREIEREQQRELEQEKKLMQLEKQDTQQYSKNQQ